MGLTKELTVETNTTNFSRECFNRIKDIMYVEKCNKGSRIFWEGESNDKLFYLMEGTVKLTKSSENGKELTLHYFFPGDLFGEFDSRFKQASTYSAEALGDCVFGVIQQSDLEVLLWQNGDIAIEFTQWQSHMQHYTQLKLRDLLFHGKDGALASMLIRTANTYGKRSGDTIIITEPLTNSDYANLIGSSRETVNRMLSTFKKKKLISYEKGRMEILNLDQLKKICCCEECPLAICRL